MSWDVSLLRFARRYDTLEEVEEHAEMLSLGDIEHIQQAAQAAFGNVWWEPDQRWGCWDNGVDSVEFNLGRDEPTTYLSLHVRATDAVIPGILDFADRLSAQVIDVDAGSFLTAEQAASGLAAWRRYRDQVLEVSAPTDDPI